MQGATSTTKQPSRVLATTPADPAEAAKHFAAKLAFETDPSDVWADQQNGSADFVLVDSRSKQAFEDEHIPGAINIPYRTMDASTTSRLDKNKVVVVYCAGVHCNASTKGALRLSQLGFRVKEMLHGLEGWKLEGYPVNRAGAVATLNAGAASKR